jgi:hypothetical protein
MPEIPWCGSQLQVRAYVVPRYCWTTASIDVVIDGQPVLQTGGKLRVVGSHAGDFEHRGLTHRAELFWGKFTKGEFPFILTIDDEEVLTSTVPVENWKAVSLGWTLALCGILGFILFYLVPLWRT